MILIGVEPNGQNINELNEADISTNGSKIYSITKETFTSVKEIIEIPQIETIKNIGALQALSAPASCAFSM